MSAPNTTFNWSELSRSSQRAFGWAEVRAGTRTNSDTPDLVNAEDILIGAAKTHRKSSELYELFDYLGLPIAPFLDGFKGEGQSGIDELTGPKNLRSFPAFDSEVSSILSKSFELKNEVNESPDSRRPDNRVHLKDLFGGIFTTSNEASRRLANALNSAPVVYETLTDSYPDYLKGRTGERYEEFLAQRHPYSAYSGYDSDSRASKDLIGIGPEVNAFAYLIASKNLIPPLAIGLFGDWGSGKSYFMEQLRKRIYKITSDVRARTESQRDIEIYKSIVQIEFNAWHYVEGELWASLVEHIFSNLQMSEKSRNDLLLQRKNYWLGELGKAQEDKEVVEKRKEFLENELEKQRTRLDEIEAERLTQLRQLEDLRSKGPLGLYRDYRTELNEQLGQLITDQAFTHLAAKLAENDDISDGTLQSSLTFAANSNQVADAKTALAQLSDSAVCSELIEALDDEQEQDNVRLAVATLDLSNGFAELVDRASIQGLGIKDENIDDAAELLSALQELHQTLQRGNVLTTSIQQRGWLWTVSVIGLVLLGPLVGILITLNWPTIPALTSVMASVGVFLTTFTIAIKSGTRLLSRSLDQVEAAERVLEQASKEKDQEYAARLAVDERKYEQIKVEYREIKQEEEAIGEQIADIERELQGITPGSVMLDFIEERVGSDDYRKHLGVAALIRRDFDQLWRILKQYNAGLEKKDAQEDSEGDEHKFSRIVLYIDDLDRCPPDRVVDVLQAVHLLLAFPLFVVVVAVDARWLAQSLQKHYEDLLVSARHSPRPQLAQNFIRQATPHDYLEKIFQVPFWIRPLPDEARLRMVQGLLAKPGEEEEAENGSDGEQQETAVIWPKGKRARPVDVSFKTNPKPRSLEIGKEERQFTNDIGPLLGETPRSVKRFVNVYRLIKAVALPYSPEFVSDKEFAEFKLVLFLLAIVTGMPSISRTFYLQLGRSQLPQNGEAPGPTRPTKLSELLVELRSIIQGNGTTAAPVPNEQTSGDDNNNGSNSDPDPAVASMRQDVTHLDYETIEAVRDLDRLEQWVRKFSGGSWQELSLSDLAVWTPQVARFSYRIEEQ